MNEIELLKSAYRTVPEPGPTAVSHARAAFLEHLSRRRRSRRQVRLVASLAAVLGVTGVFALVFVPGRAQGLSGEQIIRRTYAVTLPPAHGIRYLRVGTGADALESWVAASPSFALHQRWTGGETEWTTCGSLSYDGRRNRLRVNVWRTPTTVRIALRQGADPLFNFQEANRAGRVTYAGKTTFRGIPAYKLVAVWGGTTDTLIVRRDSFAPLIERFDNGTAVSVLRYTGFQVLPRTSRTEPLLHLAPHRPVLVTRSGARHPAPDCEAFGAAQLRSGPVARALPGFDASTVTLRAPEAIAIGPDGVYFSEYEGGRIDVIDEKSLSVLVGPRAGITAPTGLLVRPDGSLVVVDHRRNLVRVISPTRRVSTLPGSVAAQLNDPIGIALDPRGGVDIADEQNHRIVRIGVDGKTTVIAGGGRRRGGGGYPAVDAEIGNPSYLVRDRAGNLYFTDFVDNRIRKIDRRGIISVIAPRARLDFPTGLTLGPRGDLYVSDANNNRVIRISPDGTVTTVAGNGKQGFSGDGGPAIKAALNAPAGLAVGHDGSLFIADQGNDRVRIVDARTGEITTIAGRG